MLFWIGIVVFLLVSVVIECFMPEKYRHIIPKFMICVLTFFSAFRYGLAADYFPYVDLYNSAGFPLPYIGIEVTFSILAIFLKKVGCDFQIIFAIYSGLTSIFLWKGFKYYLKDWIKITIAIALYGLMFDGFFGSMNQIRQYLVMAIFLWGSQFILEKNLKKYLVVCLAMFFIHYTSIVLVTCYCFNYIKLNRKITCFILLSSLMIAYFNIIPYIFEWGVHVLNLNNKYSNYVHFGKVNMNGGLSYVFYLGTWAFVFFNSKLADLEVILVNKLYSLFPIVLFLFAFSSAICRLRFYFVFFGIIAAIYLAYQMKNKMRILFLGMLLFGYSVVLLSVLNKDIAKNYAIENYHNNVIYQMNFNLFR